MKWDVKIFRKQKINALHSNGMFNSIFLFAEITSNRKRMIRRLQNAYIRSIIIMYYEKLFIRFRFLSQTKREQITTNE